MLQNKVLRLLNRLSPKEFKELNRFLQSPFFNTNPRIVGFYDQLKKYYPSFDSPKLEREKLYKKLFPGKQYHYQQLANLITEFTKLTEQYYVQLGLRSNPILQKKTLIDSYSERDLYDLFEKDTLDLLKTLKKNEVDPQHRHAYLLLKALAFHPQNHLISKNNEQLNDLMIALDHSYWEEKLFLASEIKNMAAFLKTEIPIPLFEEIKSIAKQQSQNSTLQAYLLLLKTLGSHSTDDYEQLKSFFERNNDKLNRKLQLTIYRSLNNYCVQKINSGNSLYYEKQLQLYQFGLDHKFILNNNIISAPAFINICNAGIYSNNLNWVSQFVEEYQDQLNPLIKEEILNIVFAVIAFYQSDYPKVIEILIHFKSDHVARHFSARKLLIRSYFELFIQDNSYYEVFLSACLSFEKMLYRNDQKATRRIESNLNFIHFLKKIAKYHLEQQLNMHSKLELIKELENYNSLILKHWLINRLNEYV